MAEAASSGTPGVRDSAMHALLVGLVTGLFVLQPLADIGWVPPGLPVLVTFLTLVSGVLALTRPTPVRWPVLACGAALLAAMALRSPIVGGIGAVAGLLLLSVALLRQVLAPGEVTGRRIEGAIALYLLVALLFANAYETLEATSPGAFTGALGTAEPFRYFSLVVQTSTGFGDITPVAPLARTLVTLQAVTGQIFIAVLLARLVSLELASRERR
ncbi:ion channel [Falsiroseomonas oryziterrae]|uniref:ion channel n=1 Tax=Falsiroseomonas oryziterrae TaxID=2911368 RepID=UPI001F3AA66E|nr:ion channel [Roseomonas sp. NPKOSM-4]